MNYTLFELNRMVRTAVEECLTDEYWVEAELTEARVSAGHCYMELIQKEKNTNTPVARASAKCWRNTWTIIQPHFERVTGQRLTAGMKVLLKVYPQFHENYGFSWIVTDIDPAYTLGDMQRKRLEIIRQLKKEGVFDLNRELEMSPFAQRVAVISSENAAGYGDFCNQLNTNQYGFRFKITIFAAIMQGERVENSVVEALNAINQEADRYDCVVIIRGGGATSDLSGFDTLTLAENVANFPLPVITGIGHDRDEAIIDLIAHTRVKTPTAAAAFLIDNLKQTADRITEAGTRIASITAARMDKEQLRLTRTEERMQAATTLNIIKEQHRLAMLEQRAEAASPVLILRRGYSITLVNGQSLRDPANVKAEDVIVTHVEKGILISKAIK